MKVITYELQVQMSEDYVIPAQTESVIAAMTKHVCESIAIPAKDCAIAIKRKSSVIVHTPSKPFALPEKRTLQQMSEILRAFKGKLTYVPSDWEKQKAKREETV
jgi:hypothetical protein